MRLIVSILTALFFSVITGNVIAEATQLPAELVTGGIFAASFIPKPAGIMVMALDVEIWKPWIVEQLFKNNEFLNYARNADEYVLQGKVVHIPQAGAASDIERNRSSLPASIHKRTDTDITYALDEFTSNPRLIEDAASILSYNKMDSAMGQDMRALKQLVAEWMMYHWRPATDADFIVQTSGSSIAAHLAGVTGNRKALKLKDFYEAVARMDDNDIPMDGRYAMFSSRMLKQLKNELSATENRDFSKAYDPKTGVIGELENVKILQRSSVIRFAEDTVPEPKAPGAATATDDNDSVLLWQQDSVERAMGEIKLFEDQNSPQYYGDIYSLLIRAGGRKLREDNKGVVGIVQSAV